MKEAHYGFKRLLPMPHFGSTQVEQALAKMRGHLSSMNFLHEIEAFRPSGPAQDGRSQEQDCSVTCAAETGRDGPRRGCDGRRELQANEIDADGNGWCPYFTRMSDLNNQLLVNAEPAGIWIFSSFST